MHHEPEDRVLKNQREQFDQMDRYFSQLIEQAAHTRLRRWRRDYSSIEAYRKSVAVNRKHFVDMLSVIQEERMPLDPEIETLAEEEKYSVRRVRLKVAPEVEAYGIMLIPRGAAGRLPAVIAQHGFAGSPETVTGLLKKEDEYHRFGARLAERGYIVFAPRVMNNAKDRTFLAHKAWLVGKRLIGLEVWKIMRVLDYLWLLPEVDRAHIGMAGLSQGGLTTLYAAACDERIAAAVVSGYFNLRTSKLAVPSPHYTAYIETLEDDKFVFDLLNEFSDSDLASLICPRPLFIEAGARDKVCYIEDVRKEFHLARDHYNRLAIGERIQLGVHDGAHAFHGVESFDFLDKWLKM